MVAGRIRLDGREHLPFSAAVLATGAAPRRLDVPGADLDGVHYLRERRRRPPARRRRAQGRPVAVVGAGWIGSEVAASARQMGAEVVLVDPGPVPLQRVLGRRGRGGVPAAARRQRRPAPARTGVVELRGAGRVEQVVLDGGEIERADVVVVGIGVTPRVELARAAGLEVDDGIVVDERLQSSRPGVYAAGDVASAWHPHYQRRLRVEHWANALHQGTTAGANAAGRTETYARLPYFFSDQYDLGMEYVGFGQPDDTVVIRGDLAGREFIAFWQRDGIVTAAMNVNVWDVLEDLKAIVADGRPLEPRHLADPAAALGELVTR